MSWSLLLERSYTPYSDQPSACLVESKSGKVYAGVRIENISYPLTIAAVQAAVCICLSEAETPKKIYVQNEKLDQLYFWSQEFSLDVEVTDNPPIQNLEDLTKGIPQDFDTLSALKSLLDQAVIPNSDFPVSALLFTENEYFEGVNVEVSDWTQGLCAERVAISKAFASGVQKFKSMEIHTRKGEISSPCGACRQVMTEVLPYHDIKLHHSDGTQSEHLTVDLLPFSFKSSALHKNS